MALKGCPAGFGLWVIDLVKVGRPAATMAADLGASGQSIYAWRRQVRIDAGLEAGSTVAGHAELVALRKRVRELETVPAIRRRATVLPRGMSTLGAVRGHQVGGREEASRQAGVRFVRCVGVGLLQLA